MVGRATGSGGLKGGRSRPFPRGRVEEGEQRLARIGASTAVQHPRALSARSYQDQLCNSQHVEVGVSDEARTKSTGRYIPSGSL